MSDEITRNPFTEAPRTKKMLILLAIFLGVVANLIVSTTNSTVLVATAQDIGGMDIYPFASSVAGILGICVLPIYGYISSKHPAARRTVLYVSLLIGAGTMIVRGAVSSMPILIAGNLLWGCVSAGNFVIGYTMIRDMFDRKQTGTYIGLIGTAMGVGKIIGPIIAGALMDNFNGGWRIFSFLIAALFVIAAVMVFFGVKVKKEDVAHLVRGSAKLDVAGCCAIIACLGALLTVLSLPATFPPGSLGFYVLLVVALLGLVAMINVIRVKKDEALIPLSVVKDKNTVLLTLMNFFSTMSVAGILFFIPAYVMRILQADPIVGSLGSSLAAGLVTTLIGISGALLSPVAGRMIGNSGSVKTVLMISIVARVVVIGGFLLFLGPNCPVWLIYILMFLAGIYNAQVTVAPAAGAQIMVKDSLRAMSNSLIQLGMSLGSGIIIAIYTFLTGIYGFEGGLNIGLWVSLGLTAALLLVTLPMKKPDAEESAG